MSDETNETQSSEADPTRSGDSPSTEPASGDPTATAAPSDEEIQRLRAEKEQTEQQLQQLQSAVQQYVAQSNQQQAAAQQQSASNPYGSQQAAGSDDVNYDDLEDEWLTSPGKASQKLASQIQQNTLSQVQQLAGPILQSQAQTAKAVAQQDPEVQEVFKKYGHEIDQYVSNVAPQHKANPELWKKAASMVRSDHFDEFVQEKASEIAAQAQSTSETGQSGDGRRTPSMREETLEKLESSTYGRKLLDKYGADGLRSHVNRVKQDLGVASFEEYVDMVAETDVIADPENPSQWKNRNLTRNR